MIRWDREFLYRKLIPDEGERSHFLSEVFTLEDNAALDRGLTLREMTTDVARRHPEHEALILAFDHRWRETLGPVIDGSVAILGELRSIGVRCLALSNWSADTFAMVEHEYPFLDWFDGLVISGREGIVKPDPEIFRLLCRRHAVEPDRAVFIDDSPANVEAARSLGFETILFTDPDALRARLIDLELLTP